MGAVLWRIILRGIAPAYSLLRFQRIENHSGFRLDGETSRMAKSSSPVVPDSRIRGKKKTSLMGIWLLPQGINAAERKKQFHTHEVK
jgi:hypothetical protein